MANVIEADTALWLRNKLDNEDQWSSGGLTSLLTADVLRNIYRCFRTLDHRVRLKLLLSFLEIRRRNLETLKSELCMIINLGLDDDDDWVRLTASILFEYPDSATFNSDARETSETFNQAVNELSVQVNDASCSWIALPCECPFLNKTALTSSFGTQPPPSKNFTLRRKPKSAALRAHLTQKASEAASQRRTSTSQPHTTPLSPLKKNAGSGLLKDNQKHHPVQSKPQLVIPLRQHTRPTLRETALPKKTKLLDITEQPIGGTSRESKKRRKHADPDAPSEEPKQKKTSERQTKQQQKAAENAAKTNPNIADYAAGLNAPEEKPEPKEAPKKEPEAEAKPSYAMIPGSVKKPPYTAPPPSLSAPRPTDVNNLITVDPNASLATQEIQRELQIRIRQQQVLRQQRQPMLKDIKLNQTQPRPTNEASGPPLPSALNQPAAPPIAKEINEPQRPMDLSQRMNPQAKRGLSLTREQMMAAQEMFKSANKVTRAEKALILGFMAGARDNPFPQQGPTLTIKLSEETEKSQVGNNSLQTTLIEMLFEMNYETGHWRRLKRTRVLAPMDEGEAT